jgi:L-alanine-DL-glutamate epimerase-like enolase superfamily enzyme
MSSNDKIRDVLVATIRSPLPEPVRFGTWEMRHREFAVCAIRSEQGVVGRAFSYTRDGPVAAIVRRSIAPGYVGQPFDDPAQLTMAAAWSNTSVLMAGVGHRALGLVDLAAWDLRGRAEGRSVAELLGGEHRPMPVTAIIGYPPSRGPEEITEEVKALRAAGWRRFKQPVAATWELTRDRLRAAREAAPDDWHGLDANYTLRTPEEVEEFVRFVGDPDLGWLEDVVPPGDALLIAQARARAGVPIAMGDDQGGFYHPQALLQADAVDAMRVDITTNGGLSRLSGVLSQIDAAGLPFSTHMFAHYHSQVLAALGREDRPIEWGVQGAGVDQYADSLAQPVVSEGLMEPLPMAPGFGDVVNLDWVGEQEVEDPDALLEAVR